MEIGYNVGNPDGGCTSIPAVHSTIPVGHWRVVIVSSHDYEGECASRHPCQSVIAADRTRRIPSLAHRTLRPSTGPRARTTLRTPSDVVRLSRPGVTVVTARSRPRVAPAASMSSRGMCHPLGCSHSSNAAKLRSDCSWWVTPDPLVTRLRQSALTRHRVDD